MRKRCPRGSRKKCRCKRKRQRGGRLDGHRLRNASRYIKGHSGQIKAFARKNRLGSRGLTALSKKWNPGGMFTKAAGLAAQKGYGWKLASMA